MDDDFNRMEKQCRYCKHSEYEYGSNFKHGWFVCYKKRDCYFPLSCKDFAEDRFLVESRRFWGILDDEKPLWNDRRDVILKFHKDFYMVIVDGVKCATTRLKDKGLNVDDVITARFVGYPDDSDLLIRINNIEKVKYGNLGKIHALKEGFLHPDLLRHELDSFYDCNNDTILVFYQFDVLSFC